MSDKGAAAEQDRMMKDCVKKEQARGMSRDQANKDCENQVRMQSKQSSGRE